MKKAQQNIEYLILITILLVVATIGYLKVSQVVSPLTKMKSAQNLVNTIAETADTVNAMGNGSIVYRWMYIPPNIESLSFEQDHVRLFMRTKDEIAEYYQKTDNTIMEGSITLFSGSRKIKFEKSDNKVIIG